MRPNIDCNLHIAYKGTHRRVTVLRLRFSISLALTLLKSVIVGGRLIENGHLRGS